MAKNGYKTTKDTLLKLETETSQTLTTKYSELSMKKCYSADDGNGNRRRKIINQRAKFIENSQSNEKEFVQENGME